MNVHSGHRERLDRKVCDSGLEKLEAHEQLEYVLFAVIPRGDTNALAHRLLKRFVSIAGVLNADVEELMEVEGVGKRAAMFLHSLPALLGVVERCEMDKPPILSSLEEVITFMTTFFHGKLMESAYVLNLNSGYRLLSVDRVSVGEKNHTHIYPVNVTKYAIRGNASAVIVVHNHPSGNVKPSTEDLFVTRKLDEALAAVDIELLDSVILSGNESFSFREKGYLEKNDKGYAKKPGAELCK